MHNIVPEGILDQDIGVVGNLSNQPSLLIARSMINASLKDTAAVAVGANFNTMGSNSIKNELSIGGSQLVQALLNDVVSIEILDKLHNPVSESVDDGLDLAWRRDEFNHLLQRTSSMLVEGNANQVMRCVLDQNSALVIIAVLQQFLAEIVTKWICHELDDMLICLKPDHMDLIWVAIFQFLLEVTAAMLILTESIDFATKLLKGHIRKSVHGYKA